MDIPLLVTIALIFLGTSIVGYVRSRITDRCLRSFHGFQVTMQRTDGRRVWGRMDLSPGGIEFVFPEQEEGAERIKASYLLYAGEFRLIQSILRHADRLTEAERYYKRALDCRERTLGPQSAEVAQSLQRLAMFYSFQHRDVKASEFRKRADGILRQLR